MNILTTLREYTSLLPDDEADVVKAIQAILQAQKHTRPCLFFLPDDSSNLDFLDFSKARRGTWEMWGEQDGDTMAIITEEGGKVCVVPPNFVKMVGGGE